MIKHILDFVSLDRGQIEISEPVGFDSAGFNIEQEDGRKGRDVQFAGGKNKLTFNKLPKHCFELIQLTITKYGFEGIIKYIIQFDETQSIIGEFDLEGMTTDEVNYIEGTIIEENETALFKTRYDVNTNLFSNLTLDDKPITPVETDRVLLKAKPIVQKSVWQWKDADLVQTFNGYGQDFAIIAPFPYSEKYDITDSYAPFQSYFVTGAPATDSELEQIRNETTLIRAKTNYKDINLKLKGVNLFVSTTGFYVVTRITIGWGTGYEVGQYQTYTLFQSQTNVNIVNQDFEYNIPFLNNTSFVFIQISISQPYSLPAGTPVSSSSIVFSSDSLEITGTSIAYNTVVPMVRLIDAMRYNAKSSSNLDIKAPRWDYGGQYYNQYITTTPLMRNLFDKPFNISSKDIVEEYLPEVYGDYSILSTGEVFYGSAYKEIDDFYTAQEIGSFEQSQYDIEGNFTGQIEGFEKSFNDKFTINQLKAKYKKFASQKENEQDNTYDLVHGEDTELLPNKKAKNIKEVNIGFIRDPFLIEQQRRKAYNLNDTAATQDDDDIYTLDIVPLTDVDRGFTETSFLQHRQNKDGNLVLVNDRTFDWVLLGIEIGTPFVIFNTSNTGSYTVINVSPTELTLLPAVFPVDNILAENTSYSYRIGPSTQLTVRTNEGFGFILELSEGNNYANLMYTIKRNILNSYNSYLATACQFKPGINIKNTLYKNNPEAITGVIGEEFVVEGGSFIPSGAILTPYIYKVNLIMNLQKYLTLQDDVRDKNGYIRTHDANGLPLLGYIQKAEATILNRGNSDLDDFICIVETVLEEKLQPYYMDIFASGDGSIIINGIIQPNEFKFDIDKYEKLHIFDEVGKLLFTPVPYNRVRVNNTIYETITTLGIALQSLRA